MVGKLLGAVANPAKSLREAMKPEKGLLSKEDVADLRTSADGAELLDAITAMRPARTVKGEGEREGYVTAEDAKRGAAAYEKYMTAPDRPFDRKQRVARLLGGIVPPPGLEVATEIVERDGKQVLRTRDYDGQCVREMEFDFVSDAQKEQKEMQYDIDRNRTEALEQRVNMYDAYENYGQYLSEEYERAVDKLRRGEKLNSAEQRAVYLHQHRQKLFDIQNKINNKEKLSKSETRLILVSQEFADNLITIGEAGKRFARDFEKSHGLPEGGLRMALIGHSRAVAKKLAEERGARSVKMLSRLATALGARLPSSGSWRRIERRWRSG